MRSTARTLGRTRRLAATAVLVALPLAATTACSEDEPIENEGVVEGVEEEVVEEDE